MAERASGAVGLTARQQAFVTAFVGEAAGNATRAARVAGYSEKMARVIGAENLTKPAIQTAIAERQAPAPAPASTASAPAAARKPEAPPVPQAGDYVHLTGPDGRQVPALITWVEEPASAASRISGGAFACRRDLRAHRGRRGGRRVGLGVARALARRLGTLHLLPSPRPHRLGQPVPPLLGLRARA
jgi:hypothetical protein